MPNEVKLLPCEPTPEMASKFENCADANKIGDEVIYTTTRYRRWWQIWKPKSWADTNRYRVVEGFITSGLFDGHISPCAKERDGRRVRGCGNKSLREHLPGPRRSQARSSA